MAKAIDILTPWAVLKPDAQVWSALCSALDASGVELIPGHSFFVSLCCRSITTYINTTKRLKASTDPKERAVLEEIRHGEWENVKKALAGCCLAPHYLDGLDGYEVFPPRSERLRIVTDN